MAFTAVADVGFTPQIISNIPTIYFILKSMVDNFYQCLQFRVISGIWS